MSDAERLAARLDKIIRDVDRARRVIRVQSFLIGALVCALILAYVR